MESLGQALQLAQKKIEEFQTHLEQAPPKINKSELNTLVKTIKSTFDQIPAKLTDSQVSTQVKPQQVNNVQQALKNLLQFLDKNPAIRDLVSSLLGASFDQKTKAFSEKLKQLRRSPATTPTTIKVAKVEKKEMGARK